MEGLCPKFNRFAGAPDRLGPPIAQVPMDCAGGAGGGTDHAERAISNLFCRSFLGKPANLLA